MSLFVCPAANPGVTGPTVFCPSSGVCPVPGCGGIVCDIHGCQRQGWHRTTEAKS